MSISKRIIRDSLWGEKPELTDAVIEYYRQNPKELDLIIDKEYFHGRFIRFFFILGTSITIVSRVLKFLFANSWAAFINEILLDVLSELGIAMFGGAMTAYLLERLKQKQYDDNVKLRKEIISRIKDHDQHP